MAQFLQEATVKKREHIEEELLLSNIYPSITNAKIKRPSLVFKEGPPSKWKKVDGKFQVPIRNFDFC